MDHQQFKLITKLDFYLYSTSNGKIIPTQISGEKYIGVTEGSREECEGSIVELIDSIREGILNHCVDLVKIKEE